MKEWIVVASRAEAKIFTRDSKNQDIRWVKTLVNKNGRRREREFESDKPGLSFAKFSGGGSPHCLEGKHSHADVVANHFAHTIGSFLKLARQEKRYEQGTIFAGPNFLGKIKHEMRDQVRNGDLVFIGKNIEKANTAQILNYMN